MKKSRFLLLLLTLMLSITTNAQSIMGTVTDDKGEPLTGATVVEKGNPQNGAIVDMNGRFNIRANEGATLVFSFMGFTTQELRARQGMKVVLKDGSFHPVDSDQLSFEICARQAFRKAARKASPVIMEPIMALEVVTPEEYMGDVIGDLNKRRGQITNMDSRGGARIIKAKVPLSEQFGYVTVLRTLSSGRATSTMEFSHYAELPANLAKEIVEKAGTRLVDDED